MADLVQDRAEGPWVYEPMVGELHQGEGIELRSESSQRNTAAEGRRRESRSHVGKRRWGRDRFGFAQAHERDLVAVERDAIATQQPISKLRLSLTEEFEIEIPNTFDGEHAIVR